VLPPAGGMPFMEREDLGPGSMLDFWHMNEVGFLVSDYRQSWLSRV